MSDLPETGQREKAYWALHLFQAKHSTKGETENGTADKLVLNLGHASIIIPQNKKLFSRPSYGRAFYLRVLRNFITR